MAKKQTWKELTGLKNGDIALCNGSVRYKNKSYKINEKVKIIEIKTNACTCLIEELNGDKNVEISVLKKYLSNIIVETITQTETNVLSEEKKDSVSENISKEEIIIDNIIEEKDNVENSLETISEENNEELIEEKTKEELDIPPYFTEYELSEELKEKIVTLSRSKNKQQTVFLNLEELDSHFPLKYNGFTPNTGIRLVLNVNYNRIPELRKYITKDLQSITVEVLYDEFKNEIFDYTFRLKRKKKIMKELKNFRLNDIYEKDLEKCVKECIIQFYKIEEEKNKLWNDL